MNGKKNLAGEENYVWMEAAGHGQFGPASSKIVSVSSGLIPVRNAIFEILD